MSHHILSNGQSLETLPVNVPLLLGLPNHQFWLCYFECMLKTFIGLISRTTASGMKQIGFSKEKFQYI
jgi:hypothetical protein